MTSVSLYQREVCIHTQKLNTLHSFEVCSIRGGSQFVFWFSGMAIVCVMNEWWSANDSIVTWMKFMKFFSTIILVYNFKRVLWILNIYFIYLFKISVQIFIQFLFRLTFCNRSCGWVGLVAPTSLINKFQSWNKVVMFG